MMRAAGLLVFVTCLASVPATAQPSPGPEGCAALSALKVPGIALSDIVADWIPAGPAPGSPAVALPAYCRLQGMLDRRIGAGSQTYGIGFALALPADWSGRFLFQGGGGFNGTLRLPTGAAASGTTPALARGFAIASTDSGHRSPNGNVLDTTFLADQQATLDFAYRAIERVTAVAKTIIARHYAQPIVHSYYSGCSTGGREAMIAAHRVATEFDGVIAGAPAMRTNYAALGTDWVSVQLNEVALRNATGQPVTRDALSSTQKQAVVEGIRNACDAGDGLRDGLVFNVSACTFDPKTLVCGGPGSGPGCLSSAQAEAVARGFGGPRTSDGRQLYSPFPFDTGIADTPQGITGLLNGGFNGSPASTTDVAAAARWADNDGPSTLTNTARWTNMTTFANRGGKMLFFHGLLEVLDWGGTGRPLVLLAGGGDTAHVFDDFAPKLTSDFHVYGITRRGFGESSFAPVTSGAATFGDDVLAVLDALKLEKPILAGHSIAGQELSSIGTRYPNRAAALVYFDAAYQYAFDNGKVPTFDEISAIGFPQRPPPTETDLANFDALRQYNIRTLGFTYPEGELRQKYSVTPEGHVGPQRTFPGGRSLLPTVTKFVDIRTPALFLVSSQSSGPWAEASTDPKIRGQIAGLSAILERQAKAIQERLPTARVVKLPVANHYVFLSNEADVLREMRAFVRDPR
jgi:pimeloyl-ACP methyl ester carboxylesterase